MIFDFNKLFFFAAGCFIITSCTTEFDVLEEGATEPVIYANINPFDSISYIRLTKSFTGDSSVYFLASDTNQVYYATASVKIDINTPEGYPVRTFTLEETQLSDRSEGIFVQCPNYAYRLDEPLITYLDEGFQVRIIGVVGDSGEVVTAQTIYHEPPEILLPLPSHKTELTLYGQDRTRVMWVDNLGTKQYELEIRVNYINNYPDHKEPAGTTCRYYYFSKRTPEDTEEITLSHIVFGDELFDDLAARVPVDTLVLYRTFTTIDFTINCYSQEILDYQESCLITADRSGRPLTNVVGGLGFFTLNITSAHKGYELDHISYDSLAFGRFTRDLGFFRR
jgi:hypothetical protein